MSDNIYTQGGRINGRCSVCGETGKHRQKKNPKYFKPYYFEVFEKTSWFRGDDKWLGRICKKCIKEGKVNEATKQLKDKGGSE